MSVLYYALFGEFDVDSTHRALRFEDSVGNNGTVTVPAGTYFLRSLTAEIKALLPSAFESSDVWDVIIIPRITLGQTSCQVAFGSNANNAVLWADGSRTIDPAIFGATAVSSAYDGTLKVGSLSLPSVWVAPEPVRRDDPAFEALSRQTRMTGGQVRTFDRGGPYVVRTVETALVSAERTFAVITPADPLRSFERFWTRHRDGRRMELHALTEIGSGALAAPTDDTLLGTFVFDEGTCAAFKPARFDAGVELYGWTMGLRGYVA